MSEDNLLEVKLKRITLKTEAGTRWFGDVDVFVGWVKQQVTALEFLRSKTRNQYGEHNLFQRIAQPWSQLRQFALQNVKPCEIETTNYAAQVDLLSEMFQKFVNKRQIFTCEAPIADFIRQRVEETDYVCASVAVAYVLGENLTNYDLSLAIGLQKVLDWERGDFGKAQSESDALVNLKESWNGELTRQSNNAETAQQNLEVLTGQAVRLLEGHQKQFNEKVSGYDASLNEALKKARDELDSITQTYEEDLALHAPVRYWGLQEKYHKGRMIFFAVSTGISAVVAIAGLIIFALTVLDQKVSELIVGRLVTMAVLTTFAVWAVRLCANLFMSHTHLHTDAQERRTMIHTYLALLRKRNALKDDERQLILQTLFRPNATGMIKDDAGPAHLVDLLNRIAPKGS